MLRISFLMLIAYSAISFANPPVVTGFFPAGASLGSKQTITALGTFPRWPVEVWCSEPKISITVEKDKGKFTLQIPADLIPKPILIRCHDVDGSSAPKFFVVGRLPEKNEIEPNDEIKSAQIIAENLVVNGKLDKAGDVDIFRVSLKKGETLLASVVANQIIQSPLDMVLEFVSEDGFIISQNHDVHGLDPQGTLTASKDGDVFVRVYGFPSMPDSSIRLFGNESSIYRLTLTKGEFADHTLPLVINRQQPTPVKVIGWNIPSDLSLLPNVIDRNTAIIHHPSLANAFSVRIVDEPILAKNQGDLVPPFAYTDQFTKPLETHIYRVVGKKSVPLIIDVQSRELDQMVNPQVRVRKITGELVSTSNLRELNADVEVRYTPTEDGPFIIEVKDLFGGFGMRSNYLLQIRSPKADFTASIPSDRVQLKPSGTVDVTATIKRMEGLKGDFTPEAIGLPPGVSMKLLPPKDKGGGNTLMLQFEAGPEAKSGPFKLNLKSTAQPDLLRSVSGIIPESAPFATEELWLAVSADPTPPPKKKKK